MARLLNGGVLPPGFYAVPFLDRDGPVEIDVATLREFDGESSTSEMGSVQAWVPPEPGLEVSVEWPGVDDIREEVLTDDGDPRLAALIEFAIPRNKRPAAGEGGFRGEVCRPPSVRVRGRGRRRSQNSEC